MYWYRLQITNKVGNLKKKWDSPNVEGQGLYLISNQPEIGRKLERMWPEDLIR
jgi:hypothetical protein